MPEAIEPLLRIQENMNGSDENNELQARRSVADDGNGSADV